MITKESLTDLSTTLHVYVLTFFISSTCLDIHVSQSTLQQTQALPSTELPTDYSNVPSMPVIIQEAPQKSAQAPSNFDVLAAQSRGKAIAPRQPLAAPSTSVDTLDDRQLQPHPHTSSLPPPSAPPQEARAMQRGKRGREIEATDPSVGRSASDFSKRRKHPTEAVGIPGTSNHLSQGYVLPFNPAAAHPMLPVPPRIPQESDLDSLCMQFRDAFRLVKASFEEDQRVRNEIYEAAIGRANARVLQAQQNADDISEHYSERMKELVKLRENQLATKLEFEHRDQQYDAIQAENRKLREEVARTRDEKAQLLDEGARVEGHIAALREDLEQERELKSHKPPEAPEARERQTSTDMSRQDAQEEIGAAKLNAERADAANDLLAEEVSSLGADLAEARNKFREVVAVHDDLSATLEEFASKDLEEMTQKMIKKHVLGVREAGQQLANKFKEAGAVLNKRKHLDTPKAHPAANTLSNGTTTHEKS